MKCRLLMLPLFCLSLLCSCGGRNDNTSSSTISSYTPSYTPTLTNTYEIGYRDLTKKEYLSWGINTENGALEIWNVFSSNNRYIVLSIPLGKYTIVITGDRINQGYLYEYGDTYLLRV